MGIDQLASHCFSNRSCTLTGRVVLFQRTGKRAARLVPAYAGDRTDAVSRFFEDEASAATDALLEQVRDETALVPAFSHPTR